MDLVSIELKIPKKYLKKTARHDKFISIVHKSWLKSIYKYGILSDFKECDLEEWPIKNDDIGKSWNQIYITVYEKKSAKVIPLPRPHSTTNINNEIDLTFFQLLHYVMQTNHRNLWKEAYKKYINDRNTRDNHNIQLTDYNTVLREILLRAYGCPIVNLNDSKLNIPHSKHYDTHPNLLQALCCVESNTCFYVFYTPFVEYTLQDCLTYSPAILESSYTKPLFVIFQLLHILRSMHDRGLTIGDVTLLDIHIDQNLWVYLIPRLDSNLIVRNEYTSAVGTNRLRSKSRNTPECNKNIHTFENLRCIHCSTKCYDRVTVNDEANLEQLCTLWVQGQISNFTYLTALNKLSGRRYGEPNCHHVFPWVTDFTSRCGNNWRDLTKSKFRLNKGDRQLDLTYDSNLKDQVQHHVSDVLSSITYYVYMARRTPKSVLCKNIRTVWVPAEYPSSIQRLQEWTPDECIPEFFSKPLVFKSIHEDLPDLEIPPWSSSPEDFVDKHREALESAYVSERLHYWIDLTFGYKLSGTAAIKSKNVILQLVDNHQILANSGLVQLFCYPHPPRQTVSSPWLARLPPKIHFVQAKPSAKKREIQSSEQEEELSTGEEDPSSPQQSNKSLSISRLLSRSRTSLNEDATNKTEPSPKSQKAPTFLSHVQPTTNQQLYDLDRKTTFQSYLNQVGVASQSKSNFILPIQKSSNSTQSTIYLPKDYNPVQQLVAVESFQNFLSKTFHTNVVDEKSEPVELDANVCCADESNSFTNRLFVDNYDVNVFESKLSHKQTVAVRRLHELQVLGCLLIEIFMSKQLRAHGLTIQLDFNARLNSCLTIVKSCSDHLPTCIKYAVELLLNCRYPTVTDKGLPPPSPHQLLQPLLTTSIFQFSNYFWPIYRFLQTLQQFKYVIHEYNVRYCNIDAAKYENLEPSHISIINNINECRIAICTNSLILLLRNIRTNITENVNLILPWVIELFGDPTAGVLAAWHLFDPIAKALGPLKTKEKLLTPLLKLYESNIEKIFKLYHHSFLLRLMVRFGLKTFLEHFITTLVEAVGGYRDFDHDVIDCPTNLRYADECEPPRDILSPLDDETEVVTTTVVIEPEPEVFVFDKEDKISSPNEMLEIISQILEPPDEIETDVVASEDESNDEKTFGIMSPTIPIPSSSRTELVTIHCEVGSKKSTENMPEDHKNDAKDVQISDISSDSIIWLSHKLGPVLTSKYLSRNLLRMLTLCYLGNENQLSCPVLDEIDSDAMLNERITGDINASRVLECLVSIAALYGEQLIILQYLPHITELIVLCKRRLTPNLEGGLISCIVLLKHLIPYLSDEVLCSNLHDNILKLIIIPSIRLVGTTRSTFPNSVTARSALARKLIDTLYLIIRRSVGAGVQQDLFTPALQRLFLIFDKCFGQYQPQLQKNSTQLEESSYLEVCRDGTTAEWTVKDGHAQRTGQDAVLSESWSPPLVAPTTELPSIEENKALIEVKQVFTSEFAYITFKPLSKFLGESFLESSLRNYNLIKDLCHAYEQEMNLNDQLQQVRPSTSNEPSPVVGSLGSNISLVGNRIEMVNNHQSNDFYKNSHFLSHKMENTSRHLRGNWLAYWEHEIGRAEKDIKFNFKQIKLQSFPSHMGSVRSLYVLDNENSFMSGSRDKTIKLWSLRSQGDGTAVSQPQWTYTGHKKSVLAITFLESLRVSVSCDSTVHIWDPFMGATLSILETSTRNCPVNLLKALPAPSSTLLAATTDGTIRIIDARLWSYAQEYKVSTGPASIIRCLAISTNGYTLSVGHSTGTLSLLDLRSGGKLLASWKAHEGELLQLAVPDSNSLISSSLDQTVSVWNLNDGKFKFHLKGTTEPVHCLCCYNNDLISGTTANRIGVYSSINDEKGGGFSSNRLRSETFKGVLTSMSILPLNKLLLLGSDSGNISLLC